MSDLLTPFLYELRRRRLNVGTQELVQLADAMSLGVHESSMDGFYYLARSLMVHRESELDQFDEAFLAHFRGIEMASRDLLKELEEWLKDPKVLEELTDEQREAMKNLDTEELMKMFEERLQEQKKRHEGGSKWIGTGGVSPFGTNGVNPNGISIRSGSKGSRKGNSAFGMADARKYKGFRSDVVLDIRQIEVALRRLRMYTRDGHDEELDIEATIDETARNFGELEIVTRPPKKSNVRVLLLMDVGGSMDPFARTCSQLFSAARRASNFRELRTYYFHNAVYGRVFTADSLREELSLNDLMAQLNGRWKLIVVGDAAMAPGELLSAGPWGFGTREERRKAPNGLECFSQLADHFERHVWLNPDPPRYWSSGTCQVMKQVMPMHHLTLDGLTEAITHLAKQSPSRMPGVRGDVQIF